MIKKLKIFYVYRIDKAEWNQCREYVVVAENKEIALQTKPCKDEHFWTDIKNIRTKFLGYATRKYKKNEIIFTSWTGA